MKKILALAGTAVVLLVTSLPAFSRGVIPYEPPRDKPSRERPDRDRPTVAAPEIDVSAGTKGLAVLIGALLIAAERLRRR